MFIYTVEPPNKNTSVPCIVIYAVMFIHVSQLVIMFYFEVVAVVSGFTVHTEGQNINLFIQDFYLCVKF